MNCSSCGEPLRISEKIYCSDCREKREKVKNAQEGEVSYDSKGRYHSTSGKVQKGARS